ncbi:MAG: beta-lactamase family protein [Turicibacter sp.]|nr:beta-lactamase family protein [Turicibacter sp.]
MRKLHKIGAGLALAASVLSSQLNVLATIENTTPSGIPFSQLPEAVKSLVAAHLGSTMPGAAIVIVSEGEIIFSEGFGYADIENQMSVDPATTIFEWGSTSKMFPWVAAMQLVERGLLDLDRPVDDYLDGAFEFEKPFTMRDLMNHQAGFGENMLGFVFDYAEVESPLSLRDALLQGMPQQIFEPGTVSAYSNFGTALAGYIVGVIAEQEFSAFERENILLPAGMDNTLNAPDWFGNEPFLQHKAIGYVPDTDGFSRTIWAHIPMYPAGQLNGTAEDLAHFALALTPPSGEAGPFFENPDTLTTLFSPSHTLAEGTFHGFMAQGGELPSFGHGGDLIGFITSMVVVPETRFGFAVVANTGGVTDPTTGRMDIRFDLENLLLGTTEPPAPTSAPNLPSATEVEGNFMRGRSMAGTFLEFLDFISVPSVVVEAIAEDTITLTMGPFGSATFLQTEPYLYQRVSAENPILGLMFGDVIRFSMDEGAPTQIHIGNGLDLLPRTAFRSNFSLISSVVVLMLAIPFFLIAPMVGLIKILKKKRVNRLNAALLLTGTLLIANNVSSIIRIAAINMFRAPSEMAIHVWLNWFLAGMAVIFIIAAGIFRKGRIFYGITATLVILLINLLQQWNFLAFF